MTLLLNVMSWLLLGLGLVFFASGAVGLLRFPDVFCRLHAVTKADTLGLGLVGAALACRADDLRTVLLLLFIWLTIMASGAVTCQLLARYRRDELAHPRISRSSGRG